MTLAETACNLSESATRAVERIEALEAALELATNALKKLEARACDPQHSGCDEGCIYVAANAITDVHNLLITRGIAW